MDRYAPATVETVSIPLPGVTVRRPAKRGDGYRLELGTFVARGATLAAAKADLARQLGITVESANIPPAFARDDDGSMIVALNTPGGVNEYRITDSGYRLTGSYAREYGTPAVVLSNCVHYTPIAARP